MPREASGHCCYSVPVFIMLSEKLSSPLLTHYGPPYSTLLYRPVLLCFMVLTNLFQIKKIILLLLYQRDECATP